MECTAVILGCILLGLLVFALLFNVWRYHALKQIPGIEPSYPVIGNAFLFTGVDAYKRCFRNENRMTKIWLGPIPVINVQHPELIQKVLTECLDKPFAYDYLELGAGLLSGRDGRIWKEHRKTLSPLFNTRILNSFIPTFERATGEILSLLDQVSDGRDVDLMEYISQCSAQMVHGTMVNIDRQPDELYRLLITNLEIILDSLGKRIMNGVYALKTFYKMSTVYRNEWRSRRLCYATVNDVIREIRTNILNRPEGAPEQVSTMETMKSKAFVERLLTIQHKGRCFTDEEIVNHAYTMLVAGYETSALQLTNICLMLAMHQEIQEKVALEIKSTFATLEAPITPEALKALPFLDMVIHETMRLYPVAPLIARQSANPITLDGVCIPKGTTFTINIAALHRRKEIWGEDFLRFEPENFSPESVSARHPFAFIPFSAGPRVCIGNRYAMISLRVFLVRLLQQYRLSTKLSRKDLKFKFQVTQKLHMPCAVQVEKRNLY
ncbi:probable cytochrome P450 313a4 [Wyeomyia smithii]|uniref:probable cytochrome P450 313a4 n=1 Tax=Wyeomyia smithii TaxID=174621 RepID=UPI002467BFA2|nr:probable cytochrome P450 313a4 [Wyeomyia smithii]